MVRAILVGILLCSASVAGVSAQTAQTADQKWLHVRVEDKGPDEETVRINLPLELVATLIPMIESEGFRHGKVHWDMDEVREIDFPAMVDALRKAEDGEYISVDGRDEKVRVMKQDDRLLIHVDEDDEKVDIQIRFDVVDALFTAEGELDLVSALQALGKEGDCEIVRVDGDDEHVRIWIDGKSTIE